MPWPEGADAAEAVLTAESYPCKVLVGGGARWDRRRSGASALPWPRGADAAGAVLRAESCPCKVLVGGGAGWATIVATAGASALPWPEGADAAGAVLTAESCPCKVLIGGGACWATIVTGAGDSAEPWSLLESTTKTEAKAVFAAGEKTLKRGRRSTVATEAYIRATNLPGGAERSSILVRGLCVRKSRKSEEAKGSPPKTALSVRGTSPPKPNPGDRGRASTKPAGSEEEDTPVFDGGETARPTAVVFCGGLWQAGEAICEKLSPIGSLGIA